MLTPAEVQRREKLPLEERDYLNRKDALPKLIQQARHDNRYASNPGDALRNGAILLQQEMVRPFQPGANGDEYVVLALVPNNFQNFVVWRRCVGTGQKATGGYDLQDYCYLGSYHRNLTEALEVYNEMVERMTEEDDN